MIYFGGVGKGRSEDVTFKLRPEVGVEMSVIQFVGGEGEERLEKSAYRKWHWKSVQGGRKRQNIRK